MPTAKFLPVLALSALLLAPLAAACGAGGGGGSGGGSLSNRGSETSRITFARLSASERESTAHVRLEGPWMLSEGEAVVASRTTAFVAGGDYTGYNCSMAYGQACSQKGEPRLVVVDQYGNELVELRGDQATASRTLRALRDLDAVIAGAVANAETTVAEAARHLERGRDPEPALAVLRRAAALEGHAVAATASELLATHGGS